MIRNRWLGVGWVYVAAAGMHLFTSAPAAGSSDTSPSPEVLNVALIKLGDLSGYNGPWRLDRRITKLLSDAVSSLSGVRAIPAPDVSTVATELIDMPEQALDPKKVRTVGRAVGADIAMGGTIDEFKLEGQGVVSYRTGGYERFIGEVTLRLTVVDARSGAILLDRERFSGKVVDNDAGIALLRGPGHRSTDETLTRLWNAPIDSDLVQGSVIGRAMAMAVTEASARIAFAVSGVATGREGRVVRIRGQDIYINIGADDDLRVGDRIMIWQNVEVLRDPQTAVLLGFTKAGPGAEAEVQDVRGDKLAVCRTRFVDSVREGDIVRFIGGHRDGKWVGARIE